MDLALFGSQLVVQENPSGEDGDSLYLMRVRTEERNGNRCVLDGLNFLGVWYVLPGKGGEEPGGSEAVGFWQSS